MYKRLVALAPSISETICTLGKGHLLVGVTDFCNYPDECLTKTKIGGFAHPNVDLILEQKPDLILTTTFHNPEKLKIFEDNNIVIKQIKTTHITDGPNAIREIGNILNLSNKAKTMALNLENDINKVFTKANQIRIKPKVCYLCTSIPFCNYKPQCQTNLLIKQLGGDLISYDKDDIVESILNNQVEIIIIPYKNSSDDYKRQINFIDSNPKIKASIAFKNNKIVNINGELLSRPGPRSAKGLNQLFNIIHDKN